MRTHIEPLNTVPSPVRALFTTRHFTAEGELLKDALARQLNIQVEHIYLPVQKHTDSVQVLDVMSEPAVADAVITGKKNIMIGVLVADCVPVLMFERVKPVIAAVHAGWRGTAHGILKNTIKQMLDGFNCSPGDIMVAIGPSIRLCSYEVDSEVKSSVVEATGKGRYYRQKGDKYVLDLSLANEIQALRMGILKKNIWRSDECTFCNPDEFYSYRYSGGASGRQGAFIGIW